MVLLYTRVKDKQSININESIEHGQSSTREHNHKLYKKSIQKNARLLYFSDTIII